jgi:hypothetical protein
MPCKLFFVILLAGVPLAADFSYTETARLTGGMAARMAGVFSREAREPQASTHYYKGNRSAQISAKSATIIDLDKETFTNVDFEKRTYTVMTFAQMREQMEKAMAQMQGRRGEQPNVQMNVKVTETGQRRAIAGMDAREVVLAFDLQSAEQRGGIGSEMRLWLAKDVPGYAEVREFQKRMGAKMAQNVDLSRYAALGGMVNQGNLQQLAKEAEKLEGVPLLTVMVMKGVGAEGAEAPQAQQPRPSSGEIVGGALGGGIGRGIGGMLGRRKKQEDTAPPAGGQQPPAQSTPGSLMEMQTEISGFSTAPVDAAKFEVPAGFKQVEPRGLGR